MAKAHLPIAIFVLLCADPCVSRTVCGLRRVFRRTDASFDTDVGKKKQIPLRPFDQSEGLIGHRIFFLFFV